MKTKSILIVAYIGMMFAACSSRDDATTLESERIPVTFTANIQQLIPSVGTRVAANTDGLSFDAFPDGTEIAVGFTDTGDMASIIQKTSGVWNYTGRKIYYPLGVEKSVFGVYPKISSPMGAFLTYPYSSPTNQTEVDNYKKADVMVAKATVSASNITPVQLQFKHLGAKITVNFSGTVSNSFTLNMTNISTSASFDKSGEEVKLVKKDGTNSITFGSCSNNGLTGIIIPQQIASGTKIFEASYGGEIYSYSTSSDITFKAGYEYTFNLSFSQTAITPSDITVGIWTADPEQSAINGTLE